jgi:excisionase family DNA binding protein
VLWGYSEAPSSPNLNSTTHYAPKLVFVSGPQRWGTFPDVRGRPIVARLRRAAAACMDARLRVRVCGASRCIWRFHWTVGAEEMADETHDFERLLSPEDVARACGLSRRAVYRAIARGELRAARLCHRLRIHPAEFERWIAEETCGATPSSATRSRRHAHGVRGGLRVLLDEGAEG